MFHREVNAQGNTHRWLLYFYRFLKDNFLHRRCCFSCIVERKIEKNTMSHSAYAVRQKGSCCILESVTVHDEYGWICKGSFASCCQLISGIGNRQSRTSMCYKCFFSISDPDFIWCVFIFLFKVVLNTKGKKEIHLYLQIGFVCINPNIFIL